MKIVHFPTWYPTNNNAVEGIFNKRLIYAINEFDNNEHIVITWHHNQIAKLKNPLIFILNFVKSLLPYKVYENQGVKIVKINYLITNEFFFGSNINRLINKINFTLFSLKLFDFQIIFHAHVAYPGAFIAQQLSIRHNIPYVITEHMSPFPFENLKNDLFKKVISPFKQANQVIAVSSFLAIQIEELIGIKTQVIPNVVGNSNFSLSKKKEPSSIFKFVILARIEAQKGIEVLFVAIEKLLIIRKDFCVDIYGDGEIKEYLIKLAISKNIQNQINWRDTLLPENVQSTIVNYNCLVSSSLHESFGVTLIEALSVGMPIIATDSGGPKDIINDFNGLLIPKNNPIELAYAMNTIIKTFHKYNHERIIKDCYNRFSYEIISEKYNLIYNKIGGTLRCVE